MTGPKLLNFNNVVAGDELPWLRQGEMMSVQVQPVGADPTVTVCNVPWAFSDQEDRDQPFNECFDKNGMNVRGEEAGMIFNFKLNGPWWTRLFLIRRFKFQLKRLAKQTDLPNAIRSSIHSALTLPDLHRHDATDFWTVQPDR